MGRSQRGKSLGVLAPGDLEREKAEGKPVGWTLEVLEEDGEPLVSGKSRAGGPVSLL